MKKLSFPPKYNVDIHNSAFPDPLVHCYIVISAVQIISSSVFIEFEQHLASGMVVPDRWEKKLGPTDPFFVAKGGDEEVIISTEI